MSPERHSWNWRAPITASAAIAVLLSSAVHAQELPVPPSTPVGAIGDVEDPLTRKLLTLLIDRGVLSSSEAQRMIAEARQERAAATPAGANASQSTSHTVTYVPAPVREQIKEELRQEMVTKAEAERWAAPDQYPQWLEGFSVSGDVRMRQEEIMQDEDNFPYLANFNAINNSSGFDINGDEHPPSINTTQDRRRTRIRARFGVVAQPDSWISAGIRLASGSDRSPVSTNQTLGADGEFSKYSLWLDRAFVRLQPTSLLAMDFGRSENPFWTTDLIFDDDLNFDGISARYRPSARGFSVFGSLGVFPVYNTAFNFGNTSIEKSESRDKYLNAAQLGISWNDLGPLAVKAAIGYFKFDDVEGRRSVEECIAPTATTTCDTDITRPLFQQHGNTLFALRTIVPEPGALSGPERQYFGLATRFEIAHARLAFELALFDPVRVRLEGEYVRNLAFDREELLALVPINNIGAAPDSEDSLNDEGDWEGGDTGWVGRIVAGHTQMTHLGAWSLSVGYKHLESDAVLDAFTDSDFHLGGTNSEGFVAAFDLGLGKNTGIGLRWYAADEITGPPLSNEIVHLDLATRF